MRRLLSAPWPLLVLSLLSGCGEEGQESQSSGSGGGTALVASGPLPLSADQGSVITGAGACASGGIAAAAFAGLVASDLSSLCGSWQKGSAAANARTIQLLLVDPTAAGTTIGVGDYPVAQNSAADGKSALVAVQQTDASCQVSQIEAYAGNVEVTEATGERLQATVVAYLPGGGGILGAFDGETCAVNATADLCSGVVAPVTSTCGP